MSAKEHDFDFKGLRSAIKSLGERHRRLADALETLGRQREDIAAAPSNRADIAAAVDLWVDSQAAGYRIALQQRLQALGRRGPLETMDDAPSHLHKLLSLDPSPRARVDSAFPAPEALALLFGDSIKSALRAEIERLEIPGEGLPARQRRAEIDKLDAQIAAAEEQLEALRKEGAAVGIRLDLEAAE